MPVYEYICSECGLKFELLRPLSQANQGASCPRCYNSAERIFSAFTSVSKGKSGSTSHVAGAGSSCASCSATSCDSCRL